MGLDIRLAAPEDAAVIADAQIASSRHAYRDILSQAYLDGLSPRAYEALWRRRFDEGDTIWVAADSGRIVAFCATSPSDEPDATPDTAELGFLYVLPAYAGKGVGGQLLAHAVSNLRRHGYREATLWVLAANEPARRFYERFGWLPDGAELYKERGGASVLQVRYRRHI